MHPGAVPPQYKCCVAGRLCHRYVQHRCLPREAMGGGLGKTVTLCSGTIIERQKPFRICSRRIALVPHSLGTGEAATEAERYPPQKAKGVQQKTRRENNSECRILSVCACVTAESSAGSSSREGMSGVLAAALPKRSSTTIERQEHVRLSSGRIAFVQTSSEVDGVYTQAGNSRH